ncbi:MAG: LptF/LptG family permease [Patescibacteria group bacterium]|nr:LptF/LptG family permease [Patescibacteria group bacterium]
MRIIDRYMLRQFLKTFVVCYLSLTGLYIVFDAFTNLEEFIRCAEKAGGLLPLMATFYGYKAILFFDRTAGLLILVSAMFTVSWIQRHNEMTALLAAGIPRVRVVAPLLIAAVCIALLAAGNRELVISRFRDEMARTPNNLIGDKAQPLDARYDNQTDILMRGERTYSDRKRIENPNFLLPSNLRHYGKQIVGENAFYHPPEGARPGGYLFEKVSQPKNLDQRPSLELEGRPVVITPQDALEWLEPDQCFVASDITFEQLTGGRAFREFSSTAQLIRGLHNASLDFGADVRVAIHTRMVTPFLDITLLFLGLPLVVTQRSRNVFMAIALCAGVTTLYLLTIIGSQHLGAMLVVSPALGAWLPLILFVPVAVGLAGAMWE